MISCGRSPRLAAQLLALLVTTAASPALLPAQQRPAIHPPVTLLPSFVGIQAGGVSGLRALSADGHLTGATAPQIGVQLAWRVQGATLLRADLNFSRQSLTTAPATDAPDLQNFTALALLERPMTTVVGLPTYALMGAGIVSRHERETDFIIRTSAAFAAGVGAQFAGRSDGMAVRGEVLAVRSGISGAARILAGIDRAQLDLQYRIGVRMPLR